MGFKYHQIIPFLFVILVASHAANLASEDYWNSKLPNTPMPKSLKDLLQPSSGWLENLNAGKGGVGVHIRHIDLQPGLFSYNNYAYIETKLHDDPMQPIPFSYNDYATTETQLHDDLNETLTLFFVEEDLHLGKRMNLHFSKSTNEAMFLPRQLADSIPFSSNKFPEILNRFSVNPTSDEAKVMKKTIKECEEISIKDEEKYCATSLESMVDFSTFMLGNPVEVISTNAQSGETKEYSIIGVKRMTSKKGVVACHKQDYTYAVFYCHKTVKTVAYQVSMVAADGSKAEVVAICHEDTSAWNPKHLAFHVLKVKPGTLPVCHFLPKDHVIWINKYSESISEY